MKHKTAFSLVEISVVILIIGILVTGISKGVDLYNNFELSNARNLTTNSRVNRIPNLTLWYETTLEKSFDKKTLNNNDLIDVWKDINPQRAEKYHASQADDNYKPRYITQAINNLPALRFENDDILRTIKINVTDFISYDQATIFLLHHSITYTNSSIIQYGSSGENRLNIHAPWGGHGDIIYFDYGMDGASYGRISSWQNPLKNYAKENKILTFIKTPTQMKFTVNVNELSISGNTNTTLKSDYQPFRIGEGSNCYLGELIIFDRALTDGEIKEVEDYLSKKWKIKLNR